MSPRRERAHAAPAEPPPDDVTDDMRALYDRYFESQDYRRRYPEPNLATLDFLRREGVADAARILDFGCGDGRYALPLLREGRGHVTGYDISRAAIAQFASRLQDTPLAARVTLLCGEPAQLDTTGPYDVALLLFGVLSHVGDRAHRLAVLRRLRALLGTEGRLLLTVPSVFRRRPLELLRAGSQRLLGKARGPQAEHGNIFFTRTIAHTPQRFFYHLYSVRELRAELAEAGFALRSVSPESVLPEWMITQSTLLGRLDAALLPLLPAALGYGIRAVAVPAPMVAA